MAKKADLLAEAAKHGLEVTEKNTIAEIEAALAGVSTDAPEAPAEEPKEGATAKAGKRSAKALAEAEAKAEKEATKKQATPLLPMAANLLSRKVQSR